MPGNHAKAHHKENTMTAAHERRAPPPSPSALPSSWAACPRRAGHRR
ncbi:hypothetical protein QJS66_23710 (plasmid) [Kocuria rhizophila]|nr:hypothetical protein QJS66_23710 [Kocuria rhizophila]